MVGTIVTVRHRGIDSPHYGHTESFVSSAETANRAKYLYHKFTRENYGSDRVVRPSDESHTLEVRGGPFPFRQRLVSVEVATDEKIEEYKRAGRVDLRMI